MWVCLSYSCLDWSALRNYWRLPVWLRCDTGKRSDYWFQNNNGASSRGRRYCKISYTRTQEYNSLKDEQRMHWSLFLIALSTDRLQKEFGLPTVTLWKCLRFSKQFPRMTSQMFLCKKQCDRPSSISPPQVSLWVFVLHILMASCL